MTKVFWVIWREFVATVATKAFVLGVFLPPAIMAVVFTLTPMLMNNAGPKVSGHIAIIDRTGAVAPRIERAFSAEEMSKRLAARIKRQMEQSPIPREAAEIAAAQMPEQIKAKLPDLVVRTLDPATDVESAKAEILSTGKEKSADAESTRLALAVIGPEALKPGADGKFGNFDLYAAAKLDVEVQNDIERQIGRAVVDTRITAKGLDIKEVRELTTPPEVEAKAVTETGDKTTGEVAKLLIPGAFMLLLWISVFTCGQALLTSTIEEKSSRVMEVLLSAVSPMQLMVGKIVGQMAVGFVILFVYAGLGMGGLIMASMMHLIDPMNIVYLCIFFVLAFFMIAAIFAAIGSAVSDLREAQSLIGPAMIVLMIPMLLWLPILRNPNSTFAQVCSFLPPISPFIMVLRLAGSEKVPTWQIPASIATAVLGAAIMAWAAAKIFRIGVLMYGKPPNFKTLFRWIRMA